MPTRPMKPAMITSVFRKAVPFQAVVRMIADAGFEVISMGAEPEHAGYDTAAGRQAVRRLLDSLGLSIDSFHAPIPACDRLFSLDPAQSREALAMGMMSMDAAADLGGGIVVFHLLLPYDIPTGPRRDAMLVQGRRNLEALVAHAGRRGVKLAMENGQRADYDEVLAMFMHEFAAAHVGFCYDSGHENVRGTGFEMLKRFGDRLFTLHLHDNAGTDDHALPFEGTIDWQEFMRVLGSLPYAGSLLLEVHPDNSRFREHTEFLRQAMLSARRLLQP